MNKKLTEIFAEIGHFGDDIGCNDKGGIHTYLETYDRLFEPFRNGCTMLEIGLAMGDSIKLWDRYFENSKIIGVDISVVFEPEQYKNEVEILELDATTPKILDYIDDNSLQIVVEDASHMEADSIKMFNHLKPKMAKGGLYFVEDVLNLNISKSNFKKLHDNIEIFDMRHINNRFDNVLILFKF